MLIALDYDGTYTKDKLLWDRFCILAKELGHTVICFTMRHNNNEEKLFSMPIEVIYTSRKAKKKFAENLGYVVDIWIDDKPAWLFEDAI